MKNLRNSLKGTYWLLLGAFGAYFSIFYGFVRRDIVLPKNGGRHIAGPWAILVGTLLLIGACACLVTAYKHFRNDGEE